MRTIKASEVRKGMRVRVEESVGGSTITTEGPVLSVDACNSEFTELIFDGTVLGIDPDHPVTVLADPEPEWVEGAWYWIEFNGSHRRPMYRDAGMWSAFTGGTSMRYEDDEVTVLGRVLIVDWPGHDVARYLSTYILEDDGRSDRLRRASLKVADAIRTQGGVR